MLISLTNLAAMSKIQKNIWIKLRLVGLININTKDWQNKSPYMKVVYECFITSKGGSRGFLWKGCTTKKWLQPQLMLYFCLFVSFNSRAGLVIIIIIIIIIVYWYPSRTLKAVTLTDTDTIHRQSKVLNNREKLTEKRFTTDRDT